MSFECIRNIKEAQPVRVSTGRKNVSALVLALAFASGPALSGPLGIDVDVSVGRGGAGVGANVGVGGGNVGAGADVGIGGGNVGVGADVGIGNGGIGVGVDVGLGGGTPGTPGTVTPGTVVPGNGVARSAIGDLVCAKGGNVTAYNGFVVRDRDGAAIGWVHEATVSTSGKILSVRLQSVGSSCYKLAGGGLNVGNGEIWANVDAASFR